MPYVMTHLYIAHNILNNTPQIKKPYDFMMGALAPDSVHFRDNYESDMKKISHLCVGDEKWGSITNNGEWSENIMRFLQENKEADNADFIYGYCSHIFADIQNNIKIWMPMRFGNKEVWEKGVGKVYYNEAYALDYKLYLLNPLQKKIWEMLENANVYDIPKVVKVDEVNKMRHSILHEQFVNREAADVSQNQYVTLSRMKEFIAEESMFIKKLLYPND